MSAIDLRLESSSPEHTQRLAQVVAEFVEVGDLLVLTGDLGAGKTCFTQGLGVGLGITERITSPTFTLASQYHGRLLLHHLDAYRLDTLGEALDLDLPDLLESGVTVIEWGELLTPVLPADHLVVAIEYRSIERTASPAGDASQESEYQEPEYQEPEYQEPEADDQRIIRLAGKGARWAERWPAMQTKLEVAAITAEDVAGEVSK